MSPCFQASASWFSHARGSRCTPTAARGIRAADAGSIPAERARARPGGQQFGRSRCKSGSLELSARAHRRRIRNPTDERAGSPDNWVLPANWRRQEPAGSKLDSTGVWRAGSGVDAGYAWTRTEITRDVAGSVGRELPNAPRHKANVWVRYRFPEGRLKHVMLATGLLHVSNRFIAGDNVTVAAASAGLDVSGSVDQARGPTAQARGRRAEHD